MAGRFLVLRPDLRGHGLSDVLPGLYTIESMARDVLDALVALGIDRLPVAGLSIGGMVAQSLAAQAPDRIWPSSWSTPRLPSRRPNSGGSAPPRSGPKA